jgi:hypothetical protein
MRGRAGFLAFLAALAAAVAAFGALVLPRLGSDADAPVGALTGAQRVLITEEANNDPPWPGARACDERHESTKRADRGDGLRS